MPDSVPNLPGLYDLITLESTDSARAHAERLASQGADEGTLVWARSQREGLGRRGNYWMSGQRNLHCAIILRPEYDFEQCCQLSLLCTICIAAAMSLQAEPLEEFRYRWPNDVLLNRGKVAGMTLSGKRSGSGVDWMVVASNVNVYEHPQSKGLEAASMRGEGFQSFDRERLLEAYAREFLSWINRWSDAGFEPVRRTWSFAGHQKGDPVGIKLGERLVAGEFENMDGKGSVSVSAAGNTEKIMLSEFFETDFHT